MKLADCAKLLDGGTIEGRDCPNGIVVFGPYAGVPAGADVSVAFDITANGEMFVAEDAVSQGGTAFHLAVEELPVGAKRPSHIGYKLHVSQQIDAFETRVWVRSPATSSFRITNLRVAVP